MITRIREAASLDRQAIRRLALENSMFTLEEMPGFDETLDGYLTSTTKHDQWLVASDENGDVVGAAYYAPEPFADRVWNLYFLAASPTRLRRGIGSMLIGQVEQRLSDAGDTLARVLLVDTSSTDDYRNARAFYARQGYREEARLREFYGPGDDKVTFWKRTG